MQEPSLITKQEGEGHLPNLVIDLVIFGFHRGKLRILLLKYQNTVLYALPGTFIREEEDLNEAACRALTERTGLRDFYLEQYYVFGDRSRHNPDPVREIMCGKGMPPVNDHWLLKRFVSVGYYALVDFTKALSHPDPLLDCCDWYDLTAVPPLILDHRAMVEKALDALCTNLDRKLTGFHLLPHTFTMGDLQRLYEVVLGKKLNRTSFQRSILNLDVLERLHKKWTGGAHKAPYLYRLKRIAV